MEANGSNPGSNPGQGELVPQPHGGAIKRGGTNPGAGRPSHKLRGSLRQILEHGLPRLAEFARGEVRLPIVGVCEQCGHERTDDLSADDVRRVIPKPADILKAIEIAGRHGLVRDSYDRELVDDLWDASERALSEHLAPSEIADAAQALRQAWTRVLVSRVVTS